VRDLTLSILRVTTVNITRNVCYHSRIIILAIIDLSEHQPLKWGRTGIQKGESSFGKASLSKHDRLCSARVANTRPRRAAPARIRGSQPRPSTGRPSSICTAHADSGSLAHSSESRVRVSEPSPACPRMPAPRQRTRAQHGPTVLRWLPRGDGASRSVEPEPYLLLRRAARATRATGAARGRFAEGPGVRGDFARWARRPAFGEARAQDGGASRCQLGQAPKLLLERLEGVPQWARGSVQTQALVS
jgi:hypothetical protein